MTPDDGSRSALRSLPAKRRRAIARSVRAGRAVDDPRDAALAVAWARRIQAVRLPRWLLLREKPHGGRTVLWVVHAAWISAVVAAAVLVPAWRAGGIVRWLVVGAVLYSLVSLPWLLSLTLRARWNAPEAERRNRELLEE